MAVDGFDRTVSYYNSLQAFDNKDVVATMAHFSVFYRMVV